MGSSTVEPNELFYILFQTVFIVICCDLNGLGNLEGDLEGDTSDIDELPRKELPILMDGCENKSWLYKKWNEESSTSAIID